MRRIGGKADAYRRQLRRFREHYADAVGKLGQLVAANELRQAGDSIAADQTDADAFVAAARWTNQFYHQSQYAPTYTLRDAVAEKKLDCVRATDMFGAVFRNAGRPRFGMSGRPVG